jgi:outer membrane protein assembly factor BamE
MNKRCGWLCPLTSPIFIVQTFMRNSVFLLPLLAALSACSSMSELPDVSTWVQPYRIDVRQGNFLTQEMVSKLRVGQTKEQVRYILGSPLIEDVFHAERWDYIYRFTPGHGETEERHFAVHFIDGKLARVGGDVAAQNAEAAAADVKAAESKTKVINIEGRTLPDQSALRAPSSSAPSQGESDEPWWKFW